VKPSPLLVLANVGPVLLAWFTIPRTKLPLLLDLGTPTAPMPTMGKNLPNLVNAFLNVSMRLRTKLPYPLAQPTLFVLHVFAKREGPKIQVPPRLKRDGTCSFLLGIICPGYFVSPGRRLSCNQRKRTIWRSAIVEDIEQSDVR